MSTLPICASRLRVSAPLRRLTTLPDAFRSQLHQMDGSLRHGRLLAFVHVLRRQGGASVSPILCAPVPGFVDTARSCQAGQGPSVGDVFETVGGAVQGDKCWFIKVAQRGMFLYLPCDTAFSRGHPARPVVRPLVEIPSYSEIAQWRVVFPTGTGTRKSNLYDDRDDKEDGRTPYFTLNSGEVFTGRACPGALGGPDMVKVGPPYETPAQGSLPMTLALSRLALPPLPFVCGHSPLPLLLC